MEIDCVLVLFLGVFSSTISSTVKATSDLNLEETVAFLKQTTKEMEDRVSVLEHGETADLKQRIKDEILAEVQEAVTKSLQQKNQILVKREVVEMESENMRDDLSVKLQELQKRLTEVEMRCEQTRTEIEEKLRNAESRLKKVDNHLLMEVLQIKPMLKGTVEKVHNVEEELTSAMLRQGLKIHSLQVQMTELNSELHSVDLIRKNTSLLTDNLRRQLNESLTFGLENIQTNLTRSMRIFENSSLKIPKDCANFSYVSKLDEQLKNLEKSSKNELGTLRSALSPRLEKLEVKSALLDDIPDMKKILTNHSIQLNRLDQHLWDDKSSGNKLVTPDTSDAPDLCQDGSIDTITRTRDGRTYVFKGDFYWEIVSSRIADGYPRKISDDWDGLEGNLDASLTWLGKTFFFKGGRFWNFTNKEMDIGYPKLIRQGFPGIPDNLDAVCIWNGNGVPYFFRGNQYWRFDLHNVPQVGHGYPVPVSSGWNGLPKSGVDAAFLWEDGRTYFFKGDKYYRFDVKLNTVPSPPYPRSTSVWWFGCKADPDTEYPTDAKRMHN